ncbi:HipA N-terminal domain-containing protein [Klebsiella quasipneumoniae]
MFDGIPAGYLAYTDENGFASFEYTEEWRQDGFSLSPLHLPLSSQTYTFPALRRNKAQHIIDETISAVSRWQNLAEEHGVPPRAEQKCLEYTQTILVTYKLQKPF